MTVNGLTELCIACTVLSRASAHGRLQLTQEKLWVGAYAEEPFELLSYRCVRAHPPLTCTASATSMKPLERMHALSNTPCKASVVLHRKPSLCMGSAVSVLHSIV